MRVLLFRPHLRPPQPLLQLHFAKRRRREPSSSARGAKTGSSGAPEPRLFRQDGRLRIVSSAQCGSTTETRRDLAIRTSRAVVLSVDPRAAGITQHLSVILALCKPATAVATTRTLHYPSHSSRRRRGNPWSQVSRRPPATTHPLQKTDSIDRLPRLAGLSARGGLALPLAPRCGRARSEPYCACARSGRCTEPLVPGLHMSCLPCERSVGCASGLAMARARGAPVGDGRARVDAADACHRCESRARALESAPVLSA